MNNQEYCPDCNSGLIPTGSHEGEDIFGEMVRRETYHCEGCDQDWDSYQLWEHAFRENEGWYYNDPRNFDDA